MNENKINIKPYSLGLSRPRKIAVAVDSVVAVRGWPSRLAVLAAMLIGHQLAIAESTYPPQQTDNLPLAVVSMPDPPAALKHPAMPRGLARAQFGQEDASDEVHHIADWIVDSHNNQDLPFLIVDKKNAKVFAFNPAGKLKASSPALLGIALGDDSAPGIGQRKLSAILPDERTTPAGRFVATLARNLHGTEILWVDYDAAISLHRVITGTQGERRAERLVSSTTADNRISYGCINVPAAFYDQFISPAFTGTSGIVYVLPEVRSLHEIFGSYDVGSLGQPQGNSSLAHVQSTSMKSAAIRLR